MGAVAFFAVGQLHIVNPEIREDIQELKAEVESLKEDIDAQIYMICENRKATKGVKYHSLCKYELSRLYFKLLDKMWEKREDCNENISQED